MFRADGAGRPVLVSLLHLDTHKSSEKEVVLNASHVTALKVKVKVSRTHLLMLFLTSVWVPFIDRVPNDRPFHKCNKFGVDCYCTNVIVYV